MALFGLAAWLFLPASGVDDGAPRRPARRVFLVDGSASLRRLRPDWQAWVRAGLRAQIAAAGAADEEVALVTYAAGATLVSGPGSAGELAERIAGRGVAPLDPRAGAGADDATEVAAALRIAARLLLEPGAASDRVVLFSDGGFTGADPGLVLAELAGRGVAIEVCEPPLPTRSDLCLVRFDVPRRLERGAPLVAVVALALTRGTDPITSTRLVIEVENGGSAERVVTELTPPRAAPGATVRWQIAVPLGSAGAGRTVLSATLALAPGVDPVPENDVATASAVAAGALVIGVAAMPADMPRARAWLTPSGSSALPGIEFVFLDVADLPGLLEELDALVTYDLPLASLPGLLLEDWLGRGRGWLAVSGWRFLSDWFPGRAARGLARLLPLEPAPLDQRERDVILLVDGSGSMAGEPFGAVRAATLELVAAALPGDRISMSFFTTGLEPERLIRERRTTAAGDAREGSAVAARLIAARVPGGQTMILRSLEQFAERRAGTATETLALLLTDGREREVLFDPVARAATLSGALERVRTRLHVVAVGADPDLEFLSLLARPGEAVTRAEGLADLESIFRRAVGGARLRAGEALAVRAVDGGPPSLVAEALGAAATLPPLQIFVRNRLRPGAEAAWLGDQREPILGLQRVGAGRTALLSTCPQPEWAAAWCDRGGAGQPSEFGPLLRWLARAGRAAAEGEAPLTITLAAGALHLSGLDHSWPARIEARLVRAVDPLRDAPPVVPIVFLPAFQPSGATAPGHRVAAWPPVLADTRDVRVQFERRGPAPKAETGRVLPIHRSPPPELSGAEGHFALEMLDSRAVRAPAVASPRNRSRRVASPHPAAPWVLALGLSAWFVAATMMGKRGVTIKGSAPATDRARGAADQARPRAKTT